MVTEKMRWLFVVINMWSSFALATFNSTFPLIPSPETIKRIENVSTGNPSNCAFGTKFYPQPVDHATFKGDYNAVNATILQQYEIVDKYYKPEGPLFLYPGVKSPNIYCVESQGLTE